ncbi:MAG: gamma-glutamyltranspeptidase [Flavobacteriales bacterium]|nr:gamma-glutamyltranspeptidase [Flavobacteriales bacterium]
MSLGAIAAGHETTLESAEEILRAGGNAFDAAISACFTLFAAEPCMGSAGAGGFAMCHSNAHGTHLLDFFTQTPRAKDVDRELDFRPVTVDFGTEQEIFHIGKASIAVPGVIAGLGELHRRYGTMPMSELVQHAKSVSKAGVHVNEFGEIDMALLQDIFKLEESVQDIFFRDGEPKKLGDTMVYPHLADFLDFIASEGDRGFYHGEIGERVSRSIYEGGGFLTRADFQNYRARWSRPMLMPYHGNQLCLPNGPSYGGAIMALLDHHRNQDGLGLTSLLGLVKEEIHEKGGIGRTMKRLLPNLDYRYQGTGEASKGTSHFSIIDAQGNAIGLTLSIGEGSGYWIPGTDMQMNNMLGELFLLPKGAHSWALDQRLNSMMSPVMVRDLEGQVRYVGGSGGAGRIPYVIYQVMEALFAHGLSLEEATLFPRQHWHEGTLHFEAGSQVEDVASDRTQRCWDEHSLFFGGVHSIYTDGSGGLQAVGDPRRYGVAKVL